MLHDRDQLARRRRHAPVGVELGDRSRRPRSHDRRHRPRPPRLPVKTAVGRSELRKTCWGCEATRQRCARSRAKAAPWVARRVLDLRCGRPDMAIRNILVPFDFSPHSREAMTWAIDLARRHEATVTLVHVIQPIAFPAAPDGTSIVSGDVSARARRELEYDLERVRKEVEAAGVLAESAIVD